MTREDVLDHLRERAENPEVAPSSVTGRGGLCYVDREVVLTAIEMLDGSTTRRQDRGLER